MRRIPVSMLRPGDRLGQALRNDRGDILVQPGVPLTPEMITSIRRRGFYAVYVRDGIADDVIPEDVISDRVRAVTVRHISELFSLSAQEKSNSRSRTSGIELARARKTQRLLEAVRQDVDLILNEVLDHDILTGITALKSYDDYTFHHSVDVAVIAILLGRSLRLRPDELRQLALGALLHDIGKMFIPAEILNKPGPLTSEEMRTMQQHTELGFRYLAEGSIGDYVANHVAFQHHERQDGGGYPRGLHGANRLRRDEHDRFDRTRIHPLAEIAAVADVYSALSSDRPYRPAMTPEAIRATIRQMAGRHLNEEVVTSFFATVPLFPVGAPVRITGGRYDGYTGVVVENRPGRLDRPVVRLTLDPRGQLLEPEEFATHTDPDCMLTTPPPAPAPPLAAAG
ncbi:MAG: HD-GYP domain-containing protein [Chloroflexota bacterium]|nr:HD-GYP domain-containing protein [Dehalococcoidia bacterium]MDW8254366.1 HD-GYP domain-containing protein [Chloroflexota bacterium]